MEVSMSELIIKLNNEIVALEQTILISGKNIEATVENADEKRVMIL